MVKTSKTQIKIKNKNSHKTSRGKNRKLKIKKDSKGNNLRKLFKNTHIRTKNKNNHKKKGKKYYNGESKQNLKINTLKQLHQKRPKRKITKLGKSENGFNLSKLNALSKPLMDLQKLNDESSENENEIKMEEDNNNDNNSDNDIDNDNDNDKMIDNAIKISNLPTTYKPGSQIELPQQINFRHWKKIQNTHNSKLIEFNPKATKSWQHTIYYKKEKESMKEIENELRDEIRADKHLEKMKKHQRMEMRKQNIMRGLVVKPIRNMHKLKRFTKKQWKSVMKASVSIQTPHNSLRSGFVQRQQV